MDVQEEALDAGLLPNTSNWGEEPEAIWGMLNTEFNSVDFRGKVKSEKGDYVAYYQNVYKALVGEEDLIVQPDQAKNTIKVIELAMKSHAEKCTLPFN